MTRSTFSEAGGLCVLPTLLPGTGVVAGEPPSIMVGTGQGTCRSTEKHATWLTRQGTYRRVICFIMPSSLFVLCFAVRMRSTVLLARKKQRKVHGRSFLEPDVQHPLSKTWCSIRISDPCSPNPCLTRNTGLDTRATGPLLTRNETRRFVHKTPPP